MKIYGFATNNVLKVVLTACELGLDFEFVMLNPGTGEHKSEDHIKRHPMGKVPVVEDDGDYLFESNAICRYLANREESRMYGGSAKARGQIDQWVEFITHHLGRALGVYFFEEVVKPRMLNQDPSQAALRAAAGLLDDNMPIVDAVLESRQFVVSDHITIADTIFYGYLFVKGMGNLEIERFGNVDRWYAEMSARPAVEKARGILTSSCEIGSAICEID